MTGHSGHECPARSAADTHMCEGRLGRVNALMPEALMPADKLSGKFGHVSAETNRTKTHPPFRGCVSVVRPGKRIHP
jgi:hypothetical protein